MLTVREIKDGFQLVFPKEVMGQLGLKDKDKVEFEIKEDGILLKAKHPQANRVGEVAFQNDTLEEIKRKMQKRVGLTKDEMEIAAQAGLQEIWALFKEVANRQEEVDRRQSEAVKVQSYTIFIRNLRHPSYRLRHPIPVLIERDSDVIIATCHDIGMYGTGADVQEALSDLCAAIIKYYETLKDDELLPSQKSAFLKQIIDENIKPDPWLEIRGMFADDQDFDDFVKEIEAYRKEQNEAYWRELDE